jgi:mannose-6-phosphate isomerase-like protein (cupin superfamily)
MIAVRTITRPDEVLETPDGLARLETVRPGGLSVSRVTLQPGWTWAKSVQPLAGGESCQVAHNQLIISGRIRVRMDDGEEAEAGPGDVITASPGHHAEVIGSEPLVAWDFALAGEGIGDDLSR